ncbi:MAG: glycoside hydrolase family 127 protein [Candidatus Wallacebacter cryptica]
MIEPKQVRIKDGFWSRYQELITNEVIPYQWRAMNDQIPDAPKSHAIKNLQIAGGSETGEFHGFIFQDSDVYKWLEAVAYSLMTHPDSELEQLADIVVEIIAKAQHPDGYINSYFTIAKPEARWANLRDWHELYCAGHFFEAAAAYYQAVGNTQVLDTARKFVDYLLEVFGSNPEQIPGYPGHEEIELALVKLYQVTDDERYLQLSKFFIEERGRQPHFFDFESEQRDEKPAGDYRYWQAHLPVRKQTTAEGHAVRAVYLYTAVADIAYYTRDQELIETCFEVWQNVVRRRMYITGGIGASAHGESFSFDYDLPNDRAYSETCAAIGLIFWAQRMLKLIQNSEFADVMELALYNSALSGISLDGRRFFYVNPLEVWPEACHNRADQRHVKVTRQPWFGCACCPPNIARLLASLGSYIYTKTNEREIYTNLYIGGTAEIELGDQIILITQNSELPWNGKVKLTLRVAKPEQFTLALRIPGWCSAPKIAVNGEAVNLNTISDKGYAKITRVWVDGDTVDLDFPMETVLITANPKVRANSGKKAVMRGPLVYCLEEVDNGADLHNLILNANTKFDVSFDPNLLNGIAIISAEGVRELANWDDTLYRVNASLETQPVKLTFIPYYAWANRDPGEMLVWVRCR